MNLVRWNYILCVLIFILFTNTNLLSQNCRLDETVYVSPTGALIITLLNEVQMEMNSVLEGGTSQTVRYQIDDPTYSADFSNFYLDVKGVGIISPSAEDLVAGWVEFEFTPNYSVGSGIGYDLYADVNTMSGAVWEIDSANSDLHCHEINQCQMTWFGSPSSIGANQYQGTVSAAGNLQSGNDYHLAFAVESGDPTADGSNYYIRVGSIATGTIVNATNVTADSIVFNFNTASNLSGSIFHLFGDITSTGMTFSLDEMQSILDCVPPSNTNACGAFQQFNPVIPIGTVPGMSFLDLELSSTPHLDAGVEQTLVFEIVGDLGAVNSLIFEDDMNGIIPITSITEDRITITYTPTVESGGLWLLYGTAPEIETGLSFNFLETESEIECVCDLGVNDVTLKVCESDYVQDSGTFFMDDALDADASSNITNQSIIGTQNPSNFTITYHMSMDDAVNDVNYYGNVLGLFVTTTPQIYTRVELTEECFEVAEITLELFTSGCPSCSTTNDLCSGATELSPSSPVDCNEATSSVCHSGCFTEIFNDASLGLGCYTNISPTVWYKVNIDEFATRLNVTVSTLADDNIHWSIYTGICSSLSHVPNQPNNYTCSDEDGNPTNAFSVPIEEGMDIWVAISRPSGNTPDAEYDICVETERVCESCSGDSPSDCDNGTFTVSVDGILNPSSICPDDLVEICIDFDYEADISNWLQGIIPKFGNGWDITGSNFTQDGPSLFEWIESSSTCKAYVTNNEISNLCTYVDNNGELQVCNMNCETCPCSTPLQNGDILPSGWYARSSDSSGCTADCSPSTGLGYPNVGTTNISFCFDLKVKSHTDIAGCINEMDLSVSIQTTSDAVSGCTGAIEAPCSLDPSIISPSWEIDCNCLETTLPITGLHNEKITELNFKANVLGLWHGEADLLTAYFSLDGKEWSVLKTIEVYYDYPHIDISVPQSGYLKFESDHFDSDVYYLRSSSENMQTPQFSNPVFGIIKYPVPVEVFTTNGVQVAEGLEIDFDKLPSGVYLLRYYDGLHFKTVKLVHL